MLSLLGASPQWPTVHCRQNSLQILIEESGPFELTVGSPIYRVMSWVPEENPPLDTLIVAIPYIVRVDTDRHRFPYNGRQENALVQEIL
jgi:hypothetical protein